jgi:hypothetical protein
MVNKPIISQSEINSKRDTLADPKKLAEIMPNANKEIVGKYIAAYEPRVKDLQIPNNVSLADNIRAEIGRIAPLPGGKSGRELG